MFTAFTFFFFNDTATTEIYTLSLHDALPIFVATDTATQGNWKGVYGADGFDVSQIRRAHDSTPPTLESRILSSDSNFTWTASTSDPRAPQKTAVGSTDRLTGCWISTTTFTMD